MAIIFGLIVVMAGVVIAFIWQPVLPPIKQLPRFDQAIVAKGAVLVAVGDCAVCHVGPGGKPYAGGNALQTPFGRIYASNLTPDTETGIGRWSEVAFRRAMRDGVDRTGQYLYPAFPYNHFTHATDRDIDAIYAFLMTRERVSNTVPATRLPFPFNIRPLMAGWDLLFLDHQPIATDPQKSVAWNRGKYLVEGLGHCQACHTPRNELGAEDATKAFTGAVQEGWEAPGLTADTSPAAISWSADALFRYLHQGVDARHAAAAGPMQDVSHALSTVPPDDVQAIAAYIASFTGAPSDDQIKRATNQIATSQRPDAALAHTAGAQIFAGACAGCHGAGAPMMLAGRPSLALGTAVTAPTARNATQIILHGLQPATGQSGPYMPAFAASLTDGQIAAVLSYIRARYTDRPAWSDLDHSVGQIRHEALSDGQNPSGDRTGEDNHS
jgi:mono/diheme cytochrome c family protein